MSDSEDREKPKVNFEVGETIKINDGPFLNFSGAIEEIEPENWGYAGLLTTEYRKNTSAE